jgi:HTH-type transcriptional regulator/antitoxin HigA
MEAKGVTQMELSRATGIARSRISELLASKRKLNRHQIVKLAAYFHVSPAVFLPVGENGRNSKQ